MLEVKNKSGKILSFVLAFMLLLTLVPLSVGATDSADGESANRGKISMVYLGNGDNPSSTASTPDSSSWVEGATEFWVGLTMTDCLNVDKVQYAAGKPSHFTNTGDDTVTAAQAGITFMGAGFDYDPEYVEPVFYAYGEKDENWKDDATMAGLGMAETLKTLPRYDRASYEVAVNHTETATLDASTYPTGIDSASRVVTQVTTTNVATAIFGNRKTVDNDPVFLTVIKFKLVKKPSAGTKVVAATLNKADTIFQTGNSGQRWMAQWNEDRSITPDTNLKNHFDYTGNLDLFPAPRAIESVTLKSGTAPALNALSESTALTLSNVKLTVKYTSGSPISEDVTPDSFAYGNAGVTDGSGLNPFTSGSEPSKTTHNGKHLYAIYAKNGTTYSVDLGEMTVKAAKTVASIAVEGTVANKTYGDKIATTGLTVKATYTDTTDWPTETITSGITWQVVPPTGSAANLDTNKAYHAGDGYKLKATYSNTSAETAAFNIAKKALSVPASVGTATAVTVGATGDDLKVKGTYTFKTADGLVGSDVVTADWNGAYANANTAGAVEVDVTLAATLAGAAKDNYTFAGGASKANGSISADPLKTITVTAPTGTFTTDTGIDLTTLKAKGVKNSGAVDFDAANFEAIITAGCEVFVDGVKTETAQVAVTTEGAHTIKVTKSGIEGTATVTVGAGATVAPVEKPVVGEITNASAKVTNAPADANTVKYAIVEVTDEANIVAPAADAYTAGKVAFDELKKDTKYVIFAIALGNGTDIVDSEPVHSDIFKTFKNKITILDKNEDEMSVGYADDIAELTEDELHKIVEEPSRLDGYYTEAAFEKEVEFPIALTDDLTLYAKIKKSSSGGGGGGGWNISTTKPALSLNQKTLSGHVGETATLRATLTDSTEKITWESDNEAVATVDENGVVTFVAVGTANITATAGSLKDTAEVKVVEDDVEVPAEESLINEKYTGPYVYGYEDGTFGAAREITRAEVVAMVSRLLKNPIDENKNYDTNFTDVAADAWYKNYIGFLAQYNIVEGYGDGTFAPANKITRAEMTAILARAAKFQLTGSATTFSDVDNSFWAKAYIATMAEKGLVNGYPDGTFAPNKNITRAETVTILNRMLDDSTVSGSIIPADVDSSYWAYNDIVKAMNDRVLD